MAHAQAPPDNIPLVLKTTSMFKVFQEVDALLEEAYSMIGKRPVTSPQAESYDDDEREPFDAFPNKTEKMHHWNMDDELMKRENEGHKSRRQTSSYKEPDHSDSYDTAGSELDDNGNVKLEKKSKGKDNVKRQTSSSPANRVRVHTAKGNMDIADYQHETFSRQRKSSRAVGGDADATVDMNNNEMNIILNPERHRLLSESRGSEE